MPSQKKQRTRIPAGTKWDKVVGYSRAVRAGNHVFVAGTAAVDKGKIVGRNDPYKQTIFILEKIEKALKLAGASMKEVVRTRIFVTDISQWKKIGKAHGKFFGKIQPATTMVEVKSLIEPALLVEIEAEAIISE